MKEKIEFAKANMEEFKKFVIDFCKEYNMPLPEHKEVRKAFIERFWEERH